MFIQRSNPVTGKLEWLNSEDDEDLRNEIARYNLPIAIGFVDYDLHILYVTVSMYVKIHHKIKNV